MTRPKLSREKIGAAAVPICPHCGGDMSSAAIRFEDLVFAWPLDGYVAVDGQGYAKEDGNLVLHCSACQRPSVLAISPTVVKLVAARTAKDLSYLAGGAT